MKQKLRLILQSFLVISFFFSCSANPPSNEQNVVQNQDEILPDGEYLFDIYFAEHPQLEHKGKVKVILSHQTVKVIYEGYGALSFLKKGQILDEGKLFRHQSGVWIITDNPSDTELDEVGGCTDGPSIIDFKKKIYWMC